MVCILSEPAASSRLEGGSGSFVGEEETASNYNGGGGGGCTSKLRADGVHRLFGDVRRLGREQQPPQVAEARAEAVHDDASYFRLPLQAQPELVHSLQKVLGNNL